jgi:hypothetical protein
MGEMMVLDAMAPEVPEVAIHRCVAGEACISEFTDHDEPASNHNIWLVVVRFTLKRAPPCAPVSITFVEGVDVSEVEYCAEI